MSDWQVGDLAVCVDASKFRCEHGTVHFGGHCPPLGSAHRVAAVLDAIPYSSLRTGTTPCRCPCLAFDGGMVGHVRRFRKIRPDEHEACEPEFVTLLKRSKVAA